MPPHLARTGVSDLCTTPKKTYDMAWVSALTGMQRRFLLALGGLWGIPNKPVARLSARY